MLRLVCFCLLITSSVHAGLDEYLARPEPNFAWKLQQKTTLPNGVIHQLRMTSQDWQQIRWEHSLVLYTPLKVQPFQTLFLYNTGGEPNLSNHALGTALAEKVQAPVAFLFNIPNQPLFNGKKEDALIAETYVRFLETKDENWPLLFPMVKSVVKAMDVCQIYAKQEFQSEVTRFVIAGASKRGWTSWLAAASKDPRIVAIAPLVIDTLNMQKQMKHQVESYGKPSEQVKDYTERGLIPMPNTPEAKRLWQMVDPWNYRDRITIPKLLIHGTNDPYWTQDATNLYWDDLKGEKYLLYVPNAGHGLEQKFSDGRKNRDRAVQTLGVFARMMMDQHPMPKLAWVHLEETATDASIVATSAERPKSARKWYAESKTLDFRNSTWQEEPVKILTPVDVTPNSVQIQAKHSRTEKNQVFLIEMEFEYKGTSYYRSTQLRILKAKP